MEVNRNPIFVTIFNRLQKRRRFSIRRFKEKMPDSIKIEQNVTINPGSETAVQTALTGSTVYSLPRWTAKRNMVDLMLMIMEEDGPLPMMNMRPAKKLRNAADQFYDEHHGEYEAMGRAQYGQVERVHNHNNACPKMYDELDKRRSIARVGMNGLAYKAAMRGTPQHSSFQRMTAKFDPTCPKCIKRKKRIEEERKRRRRLCKKCREQRDRRESKNKLGRVAKQRTPQPRKQQPRICRSFSRTYKPCIISSNKGFQCHLAADTKSVSTCKSSDNLSSVVSQDLTTPNIGISVKDDNNQEKIVLKSKPSHKKRVGKKPASVKSDGNNNSGQPDTETGPSVSSYNSFLSTEHEPMIE